MFLKNRRWNFIFMTTFFLLSICSIGSTVAEEKILIGAPLPLTGPYAADGEEARNALTMAVEETNAKGGLLGKKLELKFGDIGGLEAEKIKAVGERLIGAGVNVVITAYDDGGVDTQVFGQYDIPYLHGNANTLCSDPVAQNPDKFWNVFQYTFTNLDYGVDAAQYLFQLPAAMGWKSPNKRLAIIKVDYSYNLVPADELKRRAEKMGYDVVIDELTPFGIAEWGPILSKIKAKQPSYITFWNADPTDAARFMIQFRERFKSSGFNGLLYMQYTPNVPEFIELTGDLADGLIWVTGGMIENPTRTAYNKRYETRFKQPPMGLYATITRDAFDIWSRAVKRASCYKCYVEIARNIREAPYEGMCGQYVFKPTDQSAIAGEYLMPITWHQVRGRKSVIVGPGHLKKAEVRLPPWIK